MLNNQHQSQTFIEKREENEEKKKKEEEKNALSPVIPTFIVDFQKTFLPILKIWPLRHPI